MEMANHYKVSKTTVTPLGGRVLVSRNASEDFTTGGLLIPESAVRPAETGIVLAIGKKRLKQPHLDVDIGDEVVIPQFVGTEICVDGEWLTLLSRDQLFAINRNCVDSTGA